MSLPNFNWKDVSNMSQMTKERFLKGSLRYKIDRFKKLDTSKPLRDKERQKEERGDQMNQKQTNQRYAKEFAEKEKGKAVNATLTSSGISQKEEKLEPKERIIEEEKPKKISQQSHGGKEDELNSQSTDHLSKRSRIYDNAVETASEVKKVKEEEVQPVHEETPESTKVKVNGEEVIRQTSKCTVLLLYDFNSCEEIQNKLTDTIKTAFLTFKAIPLFSDDDLLGLIHASHLVVISIIALSLKVQMRLESIEAQLARSNQPHRNIYVLLDDNAKEDIDHYYFPSSFTLKRSIDSLSEVELADVSEMIEQPQPAQAIEAFEPPYPYWMPKYHLEVFSSDKEDKTRIVIRMIIPSDKDDIDFNHYGLSINEHCISIKIAGTNKDINDSKVNFYLPIDIPKAWLKYCNKEVAKPEFSVDDAFVQLTFELN